VCIWDLNILIYSPCSHSPKQQINIDEQPTTHKSPTTSDNHEHSFNTFRAPSTAASTSSSVRSSNSRPSSPTMMNVSNAEQSVNAWNAHFEQLQLQQHNDLQVGCG
jgi:hypothetical protein